ncbi:hypothetical protein PVIIG_06336 [Plasmodium vivax India VII]|uniref:Variable surface protein Vir18 n=2 Tax=Plasmodium vivax TaxID=5855 RepID=A0A0J9SHM3_PLAVI|nr:hypothetical protein PVIIG_06336 [Plasmodium vivax India VII]KMZ88882.1 hypothetical protein PVBG_06370 [Plasmodium vivax Brazil I]
MFEFYRRSFSNFFNRQDAGCLNKYYTVKSDIERQIDTFNKIKGKKVHTEWDRLNALIINTDKELKDCYERGYVKVKLNDEEKIKKFKNRCNRDSTCNNRAAPVTKPTITKALAQKTCDKGEECKNETPATVDIKSKSKLPSGAANPQSSERKVSQEQGQNQDDEQKSRQGSVIPQSLSGSTPSDGSVRTNGKTSQEFLDHRSTTSSLAETQARPLNAPSASGIRRLDSSPCDPSSECVPKKDFHLTCTSREKILDISGIQTNPSCGKTLDINNPETEDSAGKVIAGQTSSVQDVYKGISDGLHPTNRNYSSIQRADDNSHPKATDEERTGTVVPDSENTGREKVSSVGLARVPYSDVGTNSITSVDMPPYDRTSGSESNSVLFVRGATNGIEIKSGQEPGRERLCEGNSCGSEQVGELTDDNVDIFGKVMNAIQDNPQIIKTSMPIGIALLLGLLFKVN